jgi:hydrogenase maturation protein HypF
MPGGAAAIKHPWRMAAAYGVPAMPVPQWSQVAAMARAGVNSPLTSSAGRLFDAVAAVLGVRYSVNYEGQAAIELEQCADLTERDAYRAGIRAGPPFVVNGHDLVQAVVSDSAPPPVVAARFHNGVARAIADVCALVREATGVGTVALSGGVFQNLLLLERTTDLLENLGFRVLTHSRVPTNDGGISLGQTVIAAATGWR